MIWIRKVIWNFHIYCMHLIPIEFCGRLQGKQILNLKRKPTWNLETDSSMTTQHSLNPPHPPVELFPGGSIIIKGGAVMDPGPWRQPLTLPVKPEIKDQGWWSGLIHHPLPPSHDLLINLQVGQGHTQSSVLSYSSPVLFPFHSGFSLFSLFHSLPHLIYI